MTYLSLPISITVAEATKRVRAALTSASQEKFDRLLTRDPGSFIYLRTVSKSLGIILLPVKV